MLVQVASSAPDRSSSRSNIEPIAAVAVLPMTAEARAPLDRYMAENPRGKHGRIVYDLEDDLGLEPAELRERFAFYFERVPLRAEA